MDKLEAPRDIYSELPPVVVNFSKELEITAAHLLENIKRNSSESGSTPFHWAEEGKNTRAGGPIVLLPQNPKYHEFDTLTHLDVAAYLAMNYREKVLPHLPGDSVNKITEILCNSDVMPFTVAAQLHDIEKVFWVPTVNPNEPWEKHKNREKLNLLGIKDSEDNAKPEIQKHFLYSDINVSSTSPDFARLSGYYEKAGVDADKVLKILEVYSWIDKYFINSSKSNSFDGKEFVREFAKFSKDRNNDELVYGILTMVCDNLAQGSPPEQDSSFKNIIQTRISRCNLLIESI